MIKLNENIINFYFNQEKLINNFREFEKMGAVYYPLKTNSNLSILKTLKPLLNNKDHGFLISHPSHYHLLRKLKVPAKRMCLINVLAEDKFVKELYNKGVRYFTFDNLNSLLEFAKYANLKQVKIAVRLTITEVFPDKISHLGGTKEECQAMLEYLRNNICPDFGISFYLQRELFTTDDSLNIMLDYISKNFNDFGMTFVNIGGAKEYQEIDPFKLTKLKQELKLKTIILEPGRFLAGNCVDMATRITKVKEIKGIKTVIIKNGIYSGFVDVLLYHKLFEIYLMTKNDGLVKLGYEKSFADDFVFSICGGSSDSGDRLGLYYLNHKYQSELIPGAAFYVKNIGAYFEEFFMPLGGDLIIKYNIVSKKENKNE
ncbi:MAG TPA: hypothetical protein PK737_02735 [Bacilli bacterium]|nr:hypothetical protein [Bacilli bacterium]